MRRLGMTCWTRFFERDRERDLDVCPYDRPVLEYSERVRFTVRPTAMLAEVSGCPFCARVAARNDLTYARTTAVAFPDGFPVSKGHVLVVPRRHLARVEDLDAEEWAELFALVREVCRDLVDQDGVDGVNVGVNSGPAAGQTVDHTHVHVIPRRLGDVPDPRGGVRHVIPGRAEYWGQR